MTLTNEGPNTVPRVHSLDSLRGIAALAVVFHHCALIPISAEGQHAFVFHGGWKDCWSWLEKTPLRLFVDGTAAVLVFFVLSGLVLGLTFTKTDRDRYGPFLTKRVVRIWSPFAVAIIASATFQAIIGNGAVPGTSGWFGITWRIPLTPAIVMEHLAMFGSQGELDNPMWSLIHEMRISIVFPLLVLLTAWNWKVAVASTTMLAVVICQVSNPLAHQGEIHSYVGTLTYVFLFIIGIAMAQHLSALRARIKALHPPLHTVLWLVALACLLAAPRDATHVEGLKDAAKLLASSLGAFLTVTLCAAEGGAHNWLLGRVPMFLGKISYSLYLIHVVVIVAFVRATASILPVAASVPIAVFLSFLAAWAMQVYVEAPTIKLGRALARRMMPKDAVLTAR